MTKAQHLQELENAMKLMLDIAKKKNADYCGENADSDPFKNFRIVETLGIAKAEKGILVRMLDKISRISTLIDKQANQVTDEAIEDTLLDLANYALILRNLLLSKKKDNENIV